MEPTEYASPSAAAGRTPASAGTARTVNWGAAVKGVAFVTAVAVAAVVGYAAFTYAGGFLSGAIQASPMAQSALVGIGEAVTGATGWVAEQATYWFKIASHHLGNAATSALGAAGLTGQVLPNGFYETLKTTLGITGAGAAAAAAAPTAIEHFKQLDFSTTSNATLAAQGTHAAHAAHAAHFAHHAAEHAVGNGQRKPDFKGWSANFAQAPGSTSFADKVRPNGNQPTSFAAAGPAPKDSFAEQITADTAALDKALGK